MAVISDITGFSTSVRRFMQRRKYKRLDVFNGERMRLRLVKLGGREGKMAWNLKFLPRLKLRFMKSAHVKFSAKSWVAKLKDRYDGIMFNLVQSRVRRGSSARRIEAFNDKMIMEIYKSFGIDVQVLPYPASMNVETRSNLRRIRV